MKLEKAVSTTETGDIRRVMIYFSPDAYAVLSILAAEGGTSIAEVLHDAIALKKWWENVHKEGGRVIVEKEGSFREVSRISSTPYEVKYRPLR